MYPIILLGSVPENKNEISKSKENRPSKDTSSSKDHNAIDKGSSDHQRTLFEHSKESIHHQSFEHKRNNNLRKENLNSKGDFNAVKSHDVNKKKTKTENLDILENQLKNNPKDMPTDRSKSEKLSSDHVEIRHDEIKSSFQTNSRKLTDDFVMKIEHEGK